MREEIDSYRAYLVATPEKALCDQLRTMEFDSTKELYSYLLDGLRIEESTLRTLSLSQMHSIVGKSKTLTTFEMLLEALEGIKK